MDMLLRDADHLPNFMQVPGRHSLKRTNGIGPQMQGFYRGVKRGEPQRPDKRRREAVEIYISRADVPFRRFFAPTPF
jgi:hypothetical protein